MSELEIEPMSIDQLAGSFVLVCGAIGSLLLVVWQSRCRLRVNCCYIFRCDREPAPDEVAPKDKKDKKDKDKDKDSKSKDVLEDEDDVEEGDEENLLPTNASTLTPNAMN